MGNIYTKENWAQDGTLKVKVGQYVADDVVEELRDSVPPTTYKASCFQPGEAYTHSADYVELYMTFVIDNGMWKYIGLCPKGSNQPQPEMDYSTLNESRQGLKSMKLFNIIKQHGGFNEKTPSFYLHDMTDDDVIGVLPENDLQKLMKMNISDKNNYAIQHGFKINRGDTMEIIPLKDWTWIGVIERNHNLPNDEYGETHIGKLKRERGNAKRRDGAHSYQWSDTGKWGSPRAEEFYMRRTQNDIANQRRQRYGDDAVYKLSEHILTGLDKIATTSDIRRFTDLVIKKLYRTSQPYTSHRFRDNDWRSLRSFVHVLEEVDGVKELNLSGTGPYKQSQEGTYKEYLVDIETTLGSKIGGFIRCHFCGSQENPWEVYDMTVNFYRDDENNNKINENKNMKQNKIKITENELKQIVAESVKKILSEARKPSDKTVGKHTLKGLRYDKNGNPLYTSDTMSDDEKKNQGWKFSKKHGMYGQLSDPTKLSESSTDINEAIQNGELDENRVGNFIRSVFGGAKDAVGDDIDNAKDKVKGAWQDTKDAAGRVWQNTKDTAGQAWQNTKDAAENVAKGVQKRATVFKNSYNANQAYLKIMDIRKDIDDVLNSGLITGEQSVAALKNAKRCLQNLAASRKGVNSQKNKRIMNSNEEE